MTPDQQLKQAIMAEAQKAPGPNPAEQRSDKRADQKARRDARGNASFMRRMAIKFLFLGISLSASAFMLYTEEGRAMRVEFQTAIVDVVRTELEARRQAEIAVASQPEQDGQASQKWSQTGPEGITFVPARGADPAPEQRSEPRHQQASRPAVNHMPESRVPVRRLTEGG